MKATYKDYLRFRPGQPGSIWITLGTNGWAMDGVDGSSVLPAASNVTDSDQFPEWTDVRNE